MSFKNIPKEAQVLMSQFKNTPARLEFKVRGAATLPVEAKDIDPVKRYAAEVVAAKESNGYAMSMETFLDLWNSTKVEAPAKSHDLASY